MLHAGRRRYGSVIMPGRFFGGVSRDDDAGRSDDARRRGEGMREEKEGEELEELASQLVARPSGPETARGLCTNDCAHLPRTITTHSYRPKPPGKTLDAILRRLASIFFLPQTQ